MRQRGNHSIDTEGLWFITKGIFVIAIVIVGGIMLRSATGQLLINRAQAALGLLSSEATSSPLLPEEGSDSDLDQTQERRLIPIKTIEAAAPDTGKFIGVNLKEMKLYLYEDGEQIQTFEILSKGRPGSTWETPSGSYEILYKNQSHFSSIGEVYMPWSMQFYGNFFIHGWPYYPDGTDVPQGYSGGCVRLSTEDSKAVFEFADVGTPIFVYDTDLEGDQETLPPSQLSNIPVPPTVSKSYLVADLTTGEVFAEKNANTPFPIASISKLMTAVVANETISYASLITITAEAYNTYGDSGGLEVGERMPLATLYYPLLLNSSNDAAEAIAGFRGRNFFMTLMNQKAKALDMDTASFEDASGLSPRNIASAEDLFKLAKYIQERKRFIFDITETIEKHIAGDAYSNPHTFTGNNPMREREDWMGGKNGYTDEARKTLLSLFNVNDGHQDRIIAIIVLGSEDHTNDTLELLNWIKASLAQQSASQTEVSLMSQTQYTL